MPIGPILWAWRGAGWSLRARRGGQGGGVVHGDQSRCATVDTEQLPMEPHRLLDRETAGKKTAGRPRRGRFGGVRKSRSLKKRPRKKVAPLAPRPTHLSNRPSP